MDTTDTIRKKVGQIYVFQTQKYDSDTKLTHDCRCTVPFDETKTIS